MRIHLAQISSAAGDIDTNIAKHRELTEAAISHGADLIVFPELSICGYEPAIAVARAVEKNDSRFDVFQQLSNAHQLTISIGIPLKQGNGVAIAMLIFQPDAPRQVYAKKYLHEDEEPWFVSGHSTLTALGAEKEIALAICYEISVAKHSEEACQGQTSIYLSSVAKTASGVLKASERLSDLAKEHSIITMMSNCIGLCEGQEGGGKSAVWNSQGGLIGQLTAQKEGLMMFDTNTNQAREIYP
ncbi:MAG: carbon-nitrogen hydrolase family protein [Roseivirga sp.]